MVQVPDVSGMRPARAHMALLRLGKRDYRYANASDLGFAVGPRLNAAGRLDDMSTGIRCLLSEDPGESFDSPGCWTTSTGSVKTCRKRCSRRPWKR